jgi:putative transposase
MTQMARNALDETTGCLRQYRYVLRDRDPKFCSAFDQLLRTNGIQCLKLPSRSPNLNAFAERWVRSVKEECLSKLILFGEEPLRRTLKEFTTHYHEERNHQGKDNLLLFPSVPAGDARTVRAATVWAASSDSMAGSHEYFDHSGSP